MTFPFLSDLKSFVSEKTVKTSSFSFKVLTKYTVNLLLICVSVISLQQYFGEPIKCDSEYSNNKEAFALKCWIGGTYVFRSCLNGTVETNILSYGVGDQDHCLRKTYGDYTKPLKKQNLSDKQYVAAVRKYQFEDRIYQKHYQWVIPVLALQALLFYFPRAIWQNLESGLMGKLLKNTDSPVLNEEWDSQKTHIIKFMIGFSKRYHRSYLFKYVFCEILSGLALLCNLFLTQSVFNNFFTEFKPAIQALLMCDFRTFSMHSAKIFPTQAKCDYNKYGGSGSIELLDGLCFLPQNVISEKIFVFLYFWFILLCIVTVINYITIFVMLTFKFLRVSDLRRMSNHLYSRKQQSFFNYHGDIGYWFALRLLHKNLSPVLYTDFINELMTSRDKLKKMHYKVTNDDQEPEGYSGSYI